MTEKRMKQWLLYTLAVFFLGVATGATFKVAYTGLQRQELVAEVSCGPLSEEWQAEEAMKKAIAEEVQSQ